jgi:hypothetical protein
MCQGLIFRVSIRHYFYTKRKSKDEGIYKWFDSQIRKDRILTLLKKKSCPGCDECKHTRMKLLEISNDYDVVGIDSIREGKLYQLKISKGFLPILVEVKE